MVHDMPAREGCLAPKSGGNADRARQYYRAGYALAPSCYLNDDGK